MGDGDLRMPAAFKALQKSKLDGLGHIVGVNGEEPAFLQMTATQSSRESSSGDNDGNTFSEFDFSNSPETGRRSLTSTFGQQSVDRASSQGAPELRGILSRRTSNQTDMGASTVASDTPHYAGSVNADGSNESTRLKFAANTSLPVSQDSYPQQQRLLAFASTASFRTGIDLYGFKKPTYGISDGEFDRISSRYAKYMDHREEKWKSLLKAHGLNTGTNGSPPVRFPPESQKLRRYVRKGIPPKWRGNAWFWYARGHEKLNAHPGLYERLVKETEGLKNNDVEHIERDLHRTFPDNIYFRNDPVTNEESSHLKALRRVLTCFSVYQPKIGYCQSLNFIAGNLLLFIEEERAFWMLVIITQTYLAGLHEVNLEQVNISQGILMISVRDRLPKIWNALNLEQSLEENFVSNLPPISLCTAPWFMSLMVNVLPTETMLRVWDCIFLEGPKTLYRISLTIFKLVEPQLVRATDELEVFQIIQSAPKKLYDPEVLMSACFKRNNGFGHISNGDIALLRSFVQKRRKQALEGVESGTTDRHAYAKLHRGRRVKAKLSLYR